MFRMPVPAPSILMPGTALGGGPFARLWQGIQNNLNGQVLSRLYARSSPLVAGDVGAEKPDGGLRAPGELGPPPAPSDLGQKLSRLQELEAELSRAA